jgi:hypothetical protein
VKWFGAFALLCLTAGAAIAQSNRITLERIDSGRWRATYQLDQPAARLAFSRPAGFYRERVWRVITPGYRWQRDGRTQLLSADSGMTPQRVVTVEFPEFTDHLAQEYQFFQPFGDGSVAVYSGHLRATSLAPLGDSTLVHTIRVDPPAGMHAVVRGKLTRGATTHHDPLGETTYLYVGKTRPIDSRDVIAVVDPRMPRWLVTQFTREIPRLFAAYREGFGQALPTKPTLLYSIGDTVAPGLSSGGGTLPGNITMTLTGADWSRESPEAREQAYYLMAHEVAHLWNGQLARNEDQPAGSWMHEGSADAVAIIMMHRLGIIDRSGFLRRVERAVNRCAVGSAAGSLVTALRRGAGADAYNCGFLVALWSGSLVAPTDTSDGVFTLWRELLRRAGSANGSYDQAAYFEALRGLGAPETAVAGVRQFVSTQDTFALLRSGLAAAGFSVDVDTGPAPAGYDADLARMAVVHLMVQACQRVDLSWGDVATTGAVPGCDPFREAHRFSAVEGHALSTDGASVYDVVHAACSTGGVVSLEGGDGTAVAKIPCQKPMGRRPMRYRVTGK